MDDSSMSSLARQSSSEEFISELTERITTSLKQKLRNSKEKYKQEIAHLRESSESVASRLEARCYALEEQLRTLQDSVTLLELDKSKQKAAHSSQLSSISDVNVKIDKFSEDVDFIRTSIVDLNSEMTMKASAREVMRIQERLSSLATVHYVQGLEAEIRTKTPKIDTESLQSELKQLSKEVRENYAEKGSTLYEIRKVDEKLENSLRLYVTTQYFSRVTMEMQKTSDILRHKIDESTGELRRKADTNREDMEQMRKDVAGKASIAQVFELKRLVGLCATLTQVEIIAKDVQSCQDSISTLSSQVTNSLEAQDRVLQRYDEILLDKASKADVKELTLRLQAVSKHINFERRVDEMERKINQCYELNKTQIEESGKLRGEVESFAILVKNVKSEKRDIAMLKSTVQDILETLKSKADKSQLSELSDSKASSEQMSRVNKALSVMYRIDRLTIVLLEHTIKYLNGTSDFKALEFGSAEWLLKHADLVSSWVSVYEPIENDINFPSDFQQLMRPQRTLTERTPTAPTVKTPMSAGLALLTPNKKSRPVTPTYQGTGKLTTQLLQGRHTPNRQRLLQPPSLDSSLFHS